MSVGIPLGNWYMGLGLDLCGAHRARKNLVPPHTPYPIWVPMGVGVGGMRKKKINHYICIYNYMYHILYTMYLILIQYHA